MALILNWRCTKCDGNVYRDYDEQADICLQCGARYYYNLTAPQSTVNSDCPMDDREWCELHGEDYNELKAENNFRRV